ncbi:MAG: amino acid adenylation domain-containing protein, partial [Cyanobacteria bacterium P01_D01_bin.116]
MKTENIENIYQLSPLQQGILFHCLYSPESAVYFVQLCYILRGNINVTAFEKSWQQVVDSHTALRTAFYWENLEKPHQIVYRKIQVFLEQHDWRSISLSEQRQQLDNFLESERKKGFNFSLAPLMRLNLIRVADDSYYFVWSKHHLILDGWSTALVLKEIAKVYEAFCQGQNVPLATTSYGNYISWLQQQDLSKSEDFWRQLLKGIKAPTSLTSLQVHRLSDQEEKHNQQTIKLSKVTTDALRYVARQYGLTLNTLMQGAWAILLSRYSGEEDVLYGVTVSGRPPELPKVESTVGMFINTLPLRVKLAGEDFLLPWLVQLQAQLVEMRQYEYSPLVEIQEWSEIPRGLPLFESILVFENYPVDDALKVWQSNLEVEDVISFEETNYPLTVIVLPENELNIKIYYSSRFDTATINRMLGHLQALLSGIVANLQQRLSDLPLLKESEQHQLLREWNDTKVDYPLLCIHELFEVQVEKTPDAVAVVFEDQHLTYHELNGKANQLAHHLRSLGVKPEVLVGICVERSLDMVIGLLAILKAGGAYVPLDPNYPLERLQFILEQTQAPALLTQASLLETIPQHKAKVICLDTDWHTITQESQDNLCSLATSNNLAYIIYTSGSTGKPKGVQVPHSGLTNFLYSMRQTPGLTEKDTLVAVTTYSFDIAALELFLPIIVGARLVVASREIVSDGNQLLAKLIDSKATVMQATPVTWQLLLAAGWSSNYPLKVLCGGEALSASLAHEILGTGSQLWNLYGPTETTIWSTIYNIAAGKTATSTENLPASIGSPISNTQIYILDKHLQLVPIGVPGELHIGGDGLARGYLNLPELTSEKFIQNPFSNSKSQRLYKTGDLARYLPDGNIEFIGRIDNQIKIRGFRIELGEIEALLNTHPRIQEAVVIVQEDIPDNKRLVAYVICDQKNQSEAANPLQSLQIEQWQQVWQQTYAQTNSELVEIEQPNYNTVGWKSSYTGKRIPTQQMCKWVDSTVERILKLQPEHVLEIGCGTGMLLFQIAPHCLSYYGTDFSTPALDYVKEQIKCLGDSFSNVSLSQKLAHDFTNIEQGRFDTIILNSVVQYFPNINYLVEVLQGAVNSLAKGGFIFVGDVRSLPLLETFHTAINFYRASDSLTIDEFRNLVKNAVNQEQELVIDPAFFLALKQHLPQIKHVEVQLKPGDYHNELTLFRYDVIIHVAQKAYSTVTPRWLDYDEDGLNLSAIKQLLVDKKPEIIGVKHIPNARLLEEVTLVKEVSNFIGEGTIGQLRDVLQLHQFVGVEPENLWSLHDELPYSVHITWSGTGGNSCYDAIFVRNESRFGQHKIIPELGVTSSVKPWSTYANNPLKQESNRDLVSQLPSFLRSKLPDYMVPAAFVTLEALPLTPNGKVDRKALPAPELTQVSLFNIVPASTPIENLLAGIWAKILGIEKVGICSNFFELGGHSLIGTRVISQIRQVFGVELALRSLFEKPTIAGLAKEIEKAIKVDSGIEPNNIERIERSPELPLSFPQQRLWFLAQLEPDSPFYNIPAAVRLQGELDLEALQESFNEIVRRHEALRTNFLSIEGQGVAVISEEKPLTLSILDISSLSAWQQEAEVKQQATQEAQQPFDISSDHLLRVKLLRLGEQEHIILLSMHHIVSDAWSVGVLVQEFATFYSQFCNEEPLTEAELPVQYVDFAAWQRQWLQGEVLETQISYWLKQLDNAPKVLELPTDHSRPVIQTYRGANYSFELSKELSTSLAKLSQQQGSTLFMTLLAGFQTLLWRYTAQEDIIVGSPIANRNRVEIEGLIGFFVNTLVLRTNLAGNPSFEDLLLRVREVALGAYAHQDLPFELLVEKLKVERSLSHSPLFQVMFVLQNAPMSALELPGLTLTPVESDSDTSKFDLSLYMTETQEGLVGNLEYNTDLFEESSIQRMVSHLQTLLSGVVANPQQRLSELPLLRESEQHQLLREWNDTLVEYSLLCIHELFEAQVEKTPLSVAVVFEDQQLTYRELNQWANQLAHYLQSLEVGSGVLVGICFEPSLEQVVSLLAVLKANGVYVPLDPNYPQERLSFMLENSNVHTLLTKESLAEKISSQNAHIVCLDRDRDAIGKQSVENLNLQATPDDLAYAIYTSGSTGKPKAVLGKIRGIINRLHWMWKTLPFAASEVCIQKTSMNFVDHVAEIFSPLLKGIPLVVVPDNIRSDVLRLMSLLSDKKITRIVVVPSLLKAMLDTTPEELTKLQYLKYVFCSGEALPLKLASSFHEKLSSARLFNLYGSSEVAADVTCYEVNFWETGQRILQYFKPQVVREQTENQVIGVDQKSFTKPGVSAEMLARQFQRSELPSYPLTVDDYNDKLS